MTALLNPTRTPYLFDKDLAVHVVFAEVKHFAAAGVPNEADVETFTRRLQYLVDANLNWCAVDQLVIHARELATIDDGTHPNLVTQGAGHLRGALLIEFIWDITTTLGTIRTRWEQS
jgi:hypothetical protein